MLKPPYFVSRNHHYRLRRASRDRQNAVSDCGYYHADHDAQRNRRIIICFQKQVSKKEFCTLERILRDHGRREDCRVLRVRRSSELALPVNLLVMCHEI
jgi:hypothetical protein